MCVRVWRADGEVCLAWGCGPSIHPLRFNKVGDKVLYRIEWVSKYNENPYEGPYEIVQVNTNGTVRLKKGAVTDTVNIRLLKPYIG